MLGRPRWLGISLKHTACTPRAALRRTSPAASSASHRRDVAFVDVDEIAEDPAVGLWSVRVEGLLVAAAADVLHRADAAALDARATVAPTRREPGLPEVRGLDDVVVDADDLGQRRRV